MLVVSFIYETKKQILLQTGKSIRNIKVVYQYCLPLYILIVYVHVLEFGRILEPIPFSKITYIQLKIMKIRKRKARQQQKRWCAINQKCLDTHTHMHRFYPFSSISINTYICRMPIHMSTTLSYNFGEARQTENKIPLIAET